MSQPAAGLHTEQGRAALAAAMAETDPDSLAAATRLRRGFPPDLAAEALAQATLRRRARTKFGDHADELFLTADGLEQATRPAVARWRAARLRAAGIARVVDLGCGLGSDAMACLQQGLDVVAVEIDPTTAEHARANLAIVGGPTAQDDGSAERPGGPSWRVVTGDAVALAPELLAGAGPETCVFVDPARRTERGRTWDVEAFTPPWPFVLDLLAGRQSTVVKLGPGVPKQLLPSGVQAVWVAEQQAVVEAGLWRVPGAAPGHAAVLLDARHPDGLWVAATDAVLPVGPVGRYVAEPDGAVIRAGAIAATVAGAQAWLLDEHVAYLSADEVLDHPALTCFEVLEVLDLHEKVLRGWVRDHRIGTLEIKKRALDVDPAELRRRLRPKGPRSATLLLARTTDGARALVVRRLPRGQRG